MQPLHLDLEKVTVDNTVWRQVLHTTPQLQLAIMAIPAGQQVDRERHPHITQFIRVEAGNGIVRVRGIDYELSPGVAFIVEPDTYHTIINTYTQPLKLYTIYAPPADPPDAYEPTKP